MLGPVLGVSVSGTTLSFPPYPFNIRMPLRSGVVKYHVVGRIRLLQYAADQQLSQ
jgi:hypothetical protein